MLLKPVMCMSVVPAKFLAALCRPVCGQPAASAGHPYDASVYTSYIIYKEQRHVGRPFLTACVPLLFLSKKFFYPMQDSLLCEA